MDRLHVPIMEDFLLSSIATFHTTKITVTDPTKFSFIGSIPETMLACVSAASNVLQQYRKIPSSGPRELTPAMVRSIDDADKPAKKGKKSDTQKETQVSKPTKGQTPKKRKSDKAAPSQPQPKKQRKAARRLIFQSSSDSDSEYVPPKNKYAPPLESESESSDDEASGRGDTPPRSPTPEIPIRSQPRSPPPVTIPVSIPPIFPIRTSQPSTTIPIPTPILTDTTTTTTTTTTTGSHSTAPTPPVTTEPPTTTKPLSPTPSTDTTPVLGGEDLEFDSTYFSHYRVQSDEDDDKPVTKHHLKAVNDKLDQLFSSSSSGAYSDAALKALFSSVVEEHNVSLTAATKAIDASTSQCQKASLAVEFSTKECKEATAKVDKLIFEAHLFLYSLQAAAQKNSQTVNALVYNLQRSLQIERSNLEAAR
ncbi:flocculation protein FLO11-like [Lactuca sativa]|uniref:flocculation protein FLO11-like n=1 Tax=Lactuca sativa TaxID=4236 RepID=UPI0022B05681|nr:flocculation protein FLO11-like [Lactuca sativa]